MKYVNTLINEEKQVVIRKKDENSEKEVVQQKRETRGWLFSVVFLFTIIMLILFLALYDLKKAIVKY
jgi:hypothetical protein